MTGRVLLIPALLVGLGLLGGRDRRSTPRPPVPELPGPDPTTPVVAIRGEPVAPHEEPLPPGARVRIGSTRFRHPADLSTRPALVVGHYLITASDGQLTPTDLWTGRRLPPFDGGLGRLGVAWWSFFPGGLTASRDGQRFLLWNGGRVEAGRPVGRVWEIGQDPECPVTPVAFVHLPADSTDWVIERAELSPDGREVILAGWQGVMCLDLTGRRPNRLVQSQTQVLDVAAAGNRFVTASQDDFGIICFSGRYSIPTYRFVAPDPAANGNRSLRDPWERRPDQPIHLVVRDMRSGDPVATIPTPGPEPCRPRQTVLSPDGTYLAAHCDGDVIVWHVDSGDVALRVEPEARPGRARREFLVPRFSPDGRTVVVTSVSGRERRFDLWTGRPLPEAVARPGVGRHGAINPPPSPDGPTSVPPGYAGVAMDMSPDGRLIAVGDATGRLDVWRADGRACRTLRSGGEPVSAVAFSPDGECLAACDHGPVIRVWSVRTWRERHRLPVPVEDPDLWPDRLTFTPDGGRLLLSRGQMMALWELGSVGWLWDRAGMWTEARWDSAPVFSPDGRSVVTAGRGRSGSTWLDAATGVEARNLDHVGPPDERSSVSAVAVSPDGRTVATLHNERALRIHDVTSGALIRTFPESDTMVARTVLLRFSPDGRRLVTCDDAGHAHVWEVAIGQLAFTLTYPDGAIHDAHFGRDGRTLITSNHREVIVWDLSPEPGAPADPWADLGHEAPRAEQARRALLADPTRAVALLRKRLHPAAALNDADVRRLIRSLDADDYCDRQRAAAGLLAIGRRVLPALKEARLQSEEGTARLAALVRDLSAGLTADERRHVRGIEVLEQIGTPAARALIAQLATGDPAAILTEEARKSSPMTHGIVGSSRERPAGHPLSGPAWTTATTAWPTATGSLAPPTGGVGSVRGARTTD